MIATQQGLLPVKPSSRPPPRPPRSIARVPVPPLVPKSPGTPSKTISDHVTPRALLDNICLADEGFMQWSALRYIAPSMPDTYDCIGKHDTLIHEIYYADLRTKCVSILTRDVLDCLAGEPIAIPNPDIPEDLSLPFKIAPSPGKGLGLFATRFLEAGQLVVAEPPLIIVPLVLPMTSPGLSKAHTFRTLFARLEDPHRRLLLSLSNCKPASLCSREEGIIRTNGLSIELHATEGYTVAHNGVFLITSRANHSCSPNAAYIWDADAFTLTLSALRPIPVDEEITIAYTSLTAPLASRLFTLRAAYHFACACESCVRPRTDRALLQSDQNRIELDRWWARRTTFERWLKDRSMPYLALIIAHVRALEMLEQEGLHDGRARHCDMVARCFGALGETNKFVEWAARAAKEWTVVARRYSGAVQEEIALEKVGMCKKWVREPDSFEFWATRL
ncbi:hypothetical protein EW146_g8095 [Bondarzewia mesenterica]|uniref:SET domain-containing protein n=1 Tax=Bondarzewia mesenterica TaxID=1095465 RepID=A0A4S4LMP0_9AGAM|nr:hypothetical protein EW146_g8095 [Bondarzewia mesenterica]